MNLMRRGGWGGWFWKGLQYVDEQRRQNFPSTQLFRPLFFYTATSFSFVFERIVEEIIARRKDHSNEDPFRDENANIGGSASGDYPSSLPSSSSTRPSLANVFKDPTYESTMNQQSMTVGEAARGSSVCNDKSTDVAWPGQGVVGTSGLV